MTADVTPRYCEADPFEGGKQAVAEAWRNLTAVGATPLAVTDNLNFGNPERPEVMGQLVGCIRGIGEACRRSTSPSSPATSRSTTRPTASRSCRPRPSAASACWRCHEACDRRLQGRGRGDHPDRRDQGLARPERLSRDGLWPRGGRAATGRSCGRASQRRFRAFGLITAGRVTACHDLSDGGLAVALAEMAMAKGIGATIETLPAGPAHAVLSSVRIRRRYLLSLQAGAAEAVARRGRRLPACQPRSSARPAAASLPCRARQLCRSSALKQRPMRAGCRTTWPARPERVVLTHFLHANRFPLRLKML
jgi:hypothetical protein